MSVLHLTIVFCLAFICAEHQEQQLISKLNEFFKFDHNIFCWDKSVDINRLIDTKGQNPFTPTSLFSFENIDGNITGTGIENLRKIYSKNTFVIVALHHTSLESNYNLLTLIKKIQQLQLKMKIGMFFQHPASTEDLQKLFEWSWKNRIINIFATTYLNEQTTSSEELNIFTFNPFGTFNVINITGTETFENVFLRQNCNFQQHPLRAIFYRSDYFWSTAFQVMNASYTVVQYSVNKTTDYDIHVGGMSNISPPYPITIVKHHLLVIVVPEALPYGEFAAYLKAFTKNSFFGYSLILIIAVMLILSIIRWITRNRILILESVVDVLNLLMNDNTSIKYQRLHHSEFFVIVPLTFVGLVIVNGIFSNLQSYLTQPILQSQIHTIEDVYNSPLHIVAQTEYQKNLVANALNTLSKHDNWADKIRVDENVNSQAETYNRSLTFLSLLDSANKLLRVQKQLGIKGYHVTETYVHKYFHSHMVHKEFPFIDRLNEIIRRLQSAGLYDEWKRREDSLVDKLFIEEKREYFKYHTQTDVADEIEPFPIPMFIVYGWIAGSVILIIEIICKNCKSIRTAVYK